MNGSYVMAAGRQRLLPLLVAAAGLLAGCYPNGPESASDLGMVVTAKVPGAEYAGLRTFAMPDEVIVLDVDDSSAEPIDPSFNPVILEELRAQLVAAGFQDVSPDTATVTADVWVYCGAVQADVWYYYYYWGYWGGWGYYPPYVGVGSFKQGTLLWQMVLRDDAEQTIDPLWIAGINGALQSSNSATEASIRNGIRQAFAQSPYIQAAPAGK